MLQIQEIGTISQRIIQLADHFCQGNKTAFGRAADIQSGVLAGIVGGRESKPGFEILQKLLTAYPDVSAEWLLFGRGQMLQVKSDGPSKMKREVDTTSENLNSLRMHFMQLQSHYEVLRREEVQILQMQLSATSDQELIAHNNRRYVENLTLKKHIEEQGRHLRLEMSELIELLASQNRQFDNTLNGISAPQPTPFSIYRIGSEPDFTQPYSGLLTKRLGISETTAQQLINEGRLRAVNVGDEGYRVTEQAVKEFLGEASVSNS